MSPGEAVTLFFVGAVASGINSVAGGGSLLSFPYLQFGFGMNSQIANATNSISLWPGSLGGAFGFANTWPKVRPYFQLLLLPTIIGSAAGAVVFRNTSVQSFNEIVPFLILFAAILLLVQPRIKAMMARRERTISPTTGWVAQLLVAFYGGYFGAGMGIMMLAAFSLFIEGNTHELNAVKTWLGLVINLVAGALLAGYGLVNWPVAIALSLGAVVGGYAAARVSQRVDPDKLRLAIAVYGVGMGGYYFARSRGWV